MSDTLPFSSRPNPMGTDGIEFVEFATTDPTALGQLLQAMGFRCTARHRSKQVLLYRQGDINFIVNAEPDSFAQHYAQQRGHSICAIALRVKDARAATLRARELGAWEVDTGTGVMELHIPAFQGVGGSLLYLVDRYGEHSIYDVDFLPLNADSQATDAGLSRISLLTQSMPGERIGDWQDFYQHLFGFAESATASTADSRLLLSPCGKIQLRLQAAVLEHGISEGMTGVTLASHDMALTRQQLQQQGLGLSGPQQLVRHALEHAGLLQFAISKEQGN
ncbi:glyoxalase [Aquitalea sp.]|uniref:4-hydroxyphenylpyruvate dioxygenase family protein n=1 Tax=Aquitalea sp. TaxID=1872623 RepID=UPI002588F71A|nr:glyoxalase [Aquitalea sp.]